MKKMFYLFALLSLMALPLASADIITPGTVTIAINSQITNMQDFPDYTFFSISRHPIGIGHAIAISESGEIEDSCSYKFCSVSVYAIKKELFNENYINSLINSSHDDYGVIQELENYLSSNAIKVIEKIRTSETISAWDTKTSVKNYYHIDLNSVKTTPDNEIAGRNYLIILMPLLLTFIIELGIVYLFVRGSFWKTALYVFLINLVTVPIANLLPISFSLIIEAGVVIVESFAIMFLFKQKYIRALLISFVANFFSAIVGVIVLLGLFDYLF